MTIQMRFFEMTDCPTFYEISRKHEPGFDCSYDFFYETMASRDGFSFFDGDILIGALTFQLYSDNKVFVHCTIDSAYHGRWAQFGHFVRIANYIFNELGIKEIVSYGITQAQGIQKSSVRLLEGLGFSPSDTIKLYSLKKEDCLGLKWFARGRK